MIWKTNSSCKFDLIYDALICSRSLSHCVFLRVFEFCNERHLHINRSKWGGVQFMKYTNTSCAHGGFVSHKRPVTQILRSHFTVVHTYCVKGFSECGIVYDFSLCACVCMNHLISIAWKLYKCVSQTLLLTCHCVHMLWPTICNHQIINFGVNSTPGLTFLLYMLPGRPHQHKRQVNIEKNVFRERLQAFYILDFRRAKEGR